MNASCYEAGTLTLNVKPFAPAGADTVWGRSLADYEFKTASSLQKRASAYQWVVRPGGKRVRGNRYTMRMARNDWKTVN